MLHVLVLFANFWIGLKIVPSRSTKWKRLDIQIFQKFICLVNNHRQYRLENITPLPWIGQNFKPCHKRNDRSKFLEKQNQNVPTKWDKSCCMMGHNQQSSFPDFFKVWDTFQPFASLFCEILYCTNVLQIACVSLRLS